MYLIEVIRLCEAFRSLQYYFLSLIVAFSDVSVVGSQLGLAWWPASNGAAGFAATKLQFVSIVVRSKQ